MLKMSDVPDDRDKEYLSKICSKSEKKKFLFWKKRFGSLIPKHDLGFGSHYQNLVSVANQRYTVV